MQQQYHDKLRANYADIPLYEQFLRDKGRSESTVFVYSKAIQDFLSRRPNLINIDDYNNFLVEHMINKRSTHYYNAVKTFIEYFFRDKTEYKSHKNDILKNLVQKRTYEPRGNTRWVDDNDRYKVILFLEHDKHKCLAMLQNMLGVRVGDLLRLKRGEIMYELYGDLVAVRLNITAKGGRKTPKWIFEPGTIADLDYFVKNYRYDDEYYFIDRSRSKSNSQLNTIFRTNYKWYWDDLKQALQQVGISFNEFATHDFRRCSGRKVWDKYKDPETLRRFFGHRNVETSIRYLRLSGLGEADIHKDMQLG